VQKPWDGDGVKMPTTNDLEYLVELIKRIHEEKLDNWIGTTNSHHVPREES